MLTKTINKDQLILKGLREKSLQTTLNAAKEEIVALQKQLIALRAFCDKEKENNESLKQQIAQLKQKSPVKQVTTDSLKSEQLLKDLTEAKKQNKQLERVVHFLREKAQEAHLETKHLHEELASNKNEPIPAISITNPEWEEKEKVSKQEITTLKEKIQAKDEELKEAEKHFAKKMKEVSLLTEKTEEQHNVILNLQQELSEAQIKAASLQNALDLQLENEKHQQAQQQESIRSAEAQLKKWEEQYFRMQDRWQEAENRYHNIKNLEDKYNQITVLIGNLNGIVSPNKVQSTQFPELPERPLVHYKQTLFD